MNNLPTTATGVLQQFSTSLTGINIMSDQLIEAVKSGEIDPLAVRIQIKAIEMVLERVNKETIQNQLTAAAKYPEQKFEFLGAYIQKTEHGTKYNYAGCGDTIYEELAKTADKANEALKVRCEFLKTLKEPLRVVDESTGEIVLIHPPVKTSTSGLNISIK
jgi:hypothetical protein